MWRAAAAWLPSPQMRRHVPDVNTTLVASTGSSRATRCLPAKPSTVAASSTCVAFVLRCTAMSCATTHSGTLLASAGRAAPGLSTAARAASMSASTAWRCMTPPTLVTGTSARQLSRISVSSATRSSGASPARSRFTVSITMSLIVLFVAGLLMWEGTNETKRKKKNTRKRKKKQQQRDNRSFSQTEKKKKERSDGLRA